MSNFNLNTNYKPSGDQPEAIAKLTQGLFDEAKHQTLLGITGSGKTFTMANVIQNTGKPTLILSHNKTLAAQLFSEFKEMFPDNHVEYFVSYYDYYQPEAYVPRRDLYIEKEVEINEAIEQYRSSATQTLLTQKDVIVVASVSCIYGIGNPDDYMSLSRNIKVGEKYDRSKLLIHLSDLQYERRESDFFNGTYRVRGDVIDINLPADDSAIRLEYFGDEIESIKIINPLTAEIIDTPREVTIFPAKQYVTPFESLKQVIPQIRDDLDREVKAFEKNGRIVEAQRLKQRVNYDLEMLQEVGYVSGIENYSRYIEKRPIGSPPSTLLDYFPDDWLLMIDESHITLPQVRGMYMGDLARKTNLVDFGFRMRAALDNRPLKFSEFTKKINQAIYVSATPADYELELSRPAGKDYIAKQIIRPTGLLDPNIDIRPSEPRYLENLQKDLIENKYDSMSFHPNNSKFQIRNSQLANQIDDLINEIRHTIENGERVLVTTLTKKMAENLSTYLQEINIKTAYIHSDIETIERVEILKRLRLGEFDVLVGINLLREGLDLPEVSLVAIMDADKEGFLRSVTSLIQTIGRAARHQDGRVIMYADKVTQSMKKAIDITLTRRAKQIDYNKENGITPRTIQKPIKSQLENVEKASDEINEDNLTKKAELYPSFNKKQKKEFVRELETQMNIYADMMEYEKAAGIRDIVRSLQQ
jgi:excinuclease ABC subunit B